MIQVFKLEINIYQRQRHSDYSHFASRRDKVTSIRDLWAARKLRKCMKHTVFRYWIISNTVGQPSGEREVHEVSQWQLKLSDWRYFPNCDSGKKNPEDDVLTAMRRQRMLENARWLAREVHKGEKELHRERARASVRVPLGLQANRNVCTCMGTWHEIWGGGNPRIDTYSFSYIYEKRTTISAVKKRKKKIPGLTHDWQILKFQPSTVEKP